MGTCTGRQQGLTPRREGVTDSDRPIFVLGCPRSGTTLLQLMLHAHPRVAVAPETRFVLPVYQARRDFGDLRDPANRLALARWIVERKQTKFGDLGLDPQEVVDQVVAGPPTLGSALGVVLRAYARRFGKPRWGDKRPGYAQHIDVLLRLFPDAQIVHLIRDGRDCVASLKEMPWWKLDIYHAIATWAQAIDYGQRASRRLASDSYYELRYERLVSDPEGELTALCAFLGEGYDAAMSEPAGLAATMVPKRKKWHARTHGEVTTARTRSWEQRLEPWEVALCEAALGDRLRAHGYETLGAARPAAAHLARYVRVDAHRRLARRKRMLLDRWQRAREPNPVAALLTAGQLGDGEVRVE